MFSFSNQATLCDIKVGYISTQRGFVDGIGIHEANKYAKLNPGTQFIFKNRDKVEYLNINEVNTLGIGSMLPQNVAGTDSCSGVVGLNLEGDVSKSIDESYPQLETPFTGGSTVLLNRQFKNKRKKVVTVNFYGGGGVGVQAVPVISPKNGSILSVIVTNGGYGYKYPPLVKIEDNTGRGSGANVRSVLNSDRETLYVEETFEEEEDYEEYVLDKCVPALENVGYGQRWSSDGKDLGAWDPSIYFAKVTDPIRYQIERYQKFLLSFDKGIIVRDNKIINWWSTRQKAPLRITSPDQVTREKFDVKHPAWGGLAASNNIEQSNLIESSFVVYTSGGSVRDLKFIFKATNNSHSFIIRADDYKDSASPEEVKIKVAKNLTYNVTTTSLHGIQNQGLLTESSFGQRGIRQDGGTSTSIFSDIAKSAPDDDDLQVQCKQGIFSIDNGLVSYTLNDSSSFSGTSSDEILDSFMNKYAISPVPPSNVAGSDNAGKTYTFEWEEELPWEGEYHFNVQCDNETRLYINNDAIQDFQIGSGGAAGDILSNPARLKTYLSKGVHKITLDLLNHPIMETVNIKEGELATTSNDVTFKVSSSTLFGASVTIFDGSLTSAPLFFDSKEYDGLQIESTHTHTIERGKVYDVRFTSTIGNSGNVTPNGIQFTGLKKPGDLRFANEKRLEFDDDSGNGFDVNASFDIDNVTNGSAKFAADGKSFIVTGNPKVTLTYAWSDNPRKSGTALESIKIGNTTWTHLRQSSGSETHTITLGSSSITSNNQNIELKNKGKNVITMEDIPGDEAGSLDVGFFEDLICSASQGEFYNIQGRTCKFRVLPQEQVNSSQSSGERINVFNTIDWISRANRKLWKINPEAGKDANFLNRFGVLPFDPTAVGKIEKTVTSSVEVAPTGPPPSVKFEIGSSVEEFGKLYLRIVGNGKVKVGFQLRVYDQQYEGSAAAVRDVRIQADDGEILMKRERTYSSKDTGIGQFTAGKRYEVELLGGQTKKPPVPTAAMDKVGLLDNDGTDWNGDIEITSVTPVSSTKQIEETILGYPDYPNASTDAFAGFHTIVWNNLNFPQDGNYSIEVMVDDNVVMTFSSPDPTQKDIVLDKKGFRIRGDGTTGTGKSIDIKYFKAGNYTLTAVLEQIQGAALAFGNPMAIAIDVEAAFVIKQEEVVSAKSWNENPMGVAMTIDAPMPPIPIDPPKQQDGRCPNNPLWTTRSTDYKYDWDVTANDLTIDVNKIWHPVRVDAWSKFMNRYSLSPLPPLALKGTDGAGTVYRNSWQVELPYRGYYGIKGTVDNFGKIFIDGVEVLGPDADQNLDSFTSNAPKTKKIFLEKKLIDITVELENEKQFIYNTIDQKIFSTADWAVPQTQTEIPAGTTDVTFNVVIATEYLANIKISELDVESGKEYGETDVIRESFTRTVENGKVYKVELKSGSMLSQQNIFYDVPDIDLDTIGLEGSFRDEPYTPELHQENVSRRTLHFTGNFTQADFNRIELIDDGIYPGTRLIFRNEAEQVYATFEIEPQRALYGLGSVWTEGKEVASASIRVKHPELYGVKQARFVRDGNSIYINGTGEVHVRLTWNVPDLPSKYEIPFDKIQIGKGQWVWDRRETVWDPNTIEDDDGTIRRHFGMGAWTVSGSKSAADNTPNIAVRTKGERVLQMEDIPNVPAQEQGGITFDDLICSVDKGRFYDINGNVCKFTVPGEGGPKTEYSKGLISGSTKDGVIYSGPNLATYFSGILGPTLTPTWTTPEDYIANFTGKTWTLTWNNVDFPETGTYDIQAHADDVLEVKVDGVEVAKYVLGANLYDNDTEKKQNLIKSQFNVTKGKKDLELVLSNAPLNSPFRAVLPDYPGDNPTYAGVKITKKVQIAKVDPKSGTPLGKSWTENPIGISAVLIPPPCPKIIEGGGIVTEVIVTPDGEGSDYTPDGGGGSPTGTPVIIEATDVVPEDPGINYAPEDEVCIYNKETGQEICFTPPKGPFGEIPEFPVGAGQTTATNGYLTPPIIRVKTSTGSGYRGKAKLVPVIDPIVPPDDDRLIQVTDLPGLKQTGYYDGRAYYGAVFYEDGIRYAGYYDTPGQKVQIYDTLQESIDAQVTTPPSAIQRQGTDINSNDPRLNIPGTPDNLT